MNEPIVLYRKADGAVAAIEDRCAHRFAPLSMGKIVGGDRIQCPYHGLEYDGTGACVRNPHGTKNIPSRARVKSYPVIEKHKAIWVWMGDAAGRRQQNSRLRRARQRAGAAHHQARLASSSRPTIELIIDNLLDLSHTSYLHDGILGNADTVESDITVEQDGDDVVVGAPRPQSAPPGMFAQLWPDIRRRSTSSPRCAGWRRRRCGCVTGICKIGASRNRHRLSRRPYADAGERPVDALFLHRGALGRVAPTDDKLNRDLQKKVAEMRRFAFEEQDAPVIEAQQRVIEAATEPLDPVILAVDVGPVRYKRILGKMLEAEQR